MKIHWLYGPSAEERGWFPLPSYLLRRHRLMRLLRRIPPGRLLEIGCGAGTLLYELSRMGFTRSALETSDQARGAAKHVNHDNPKVDIFHQPQQKWLGEFDYIIALEVLEHIEKDEVALRQWSSWLCPSGALFVSVPAGMSRWTESDIWAGHFRRYEKAGLIELLQRVGFLILGFESYGFPLANLVEPIRARYHGKQLENERDSQPQILSRKSRNDRSGVDRSLSVFVYRLMSCFPIAVVMFFFLQLQGLFVHTDLGAGYLVHMRRK